jgi:uncharacterized protein YecE (DUF72 family)
VTLDLFNDDDSSSNPTSKAPKPAREMKSSGIEPAAAQPKQLDLAKLMPLTLSMGTSSWYFPGWKGLVWKEAYAEQQLSRKGLKAYSQHPLMRTVSLDRALYRPMTAEQYAELAAQVPDDFRFLVKVPALVSDALVREIEGPAAGRGLQANPCFLSPEVMRESCIDPLAKGMGDKLGVLVLQLSPLPREWTGNAKRLFDALAIALDCMRTIKSKVPHAIIAVEVRNPEFLRSPMREQFVEVLKAAGATYCLGSHAKLPPISEQLPILRALWPGPLVCRWNLHAKHGKFGYKDAKALYEPFDKLIDEDIETRETLAKVISGTTSAGQLAFITINNKAEGSAPLSVEKLAQTVLALTSKEPLK